MSTTTSVFVQAPESTSRRSETWKSLYAPRNDCQVDIPHVYVRTDSEVGETFESDTLERGIREPNPTKGYEKLSSILRETGNEWSGYFQEGTSSVLRDMFPLELNPLFKEYSLRYCHLNYGAVAEALESYETRLDTCQGLGFIKCMEISKKMRDMELAQFKPDSLNPEYIRMFSTFNFYTTYKQLYDEVRKLDYIVMEDYLHSLVFFPNVEELKIVLRSRRKDAFAELIYRLRDIQHSWKVTHLSLEFSDSECLSSRNVRELLKIMPSLTYFQAGPVVGINADFIDFLQSKIRSNYLFIENREGSIGRYDIQPKQQQELGIVSLCKTASTSKLYRHYLHLFKSPRNNIYDTKHTPALFSTIFSGGINHV